MNFVNIWIMNIKKVIFGFDIMKQWNVWAKKVHELCLKDTRNKGIKYLYKELMMNWCGV